ncbi:hypothetical protein [Sanguibacter massiliensis]|uniref:hypothetical protein n=1 Tax=Sanguibacter massiliensis TaxID=1973217 RepID=UPI001A910D7A|nr:hypothetical protein [Sanguibacter massiliensis]
MAYATTSSPQTVKGFGSSASTFGEWDATKVGGDFESRTWRTKYKIVDADDHKVYVRLSSWAYSLVEIGEVHTSHDNKVSGSWTDFRWAALDRMNRWGASKVSGSLATCLDVPWRSDPCSSNKTHSKKL